MIFFRKPPSLRATVIFPTFGEALFARWPLESVRNQTVKEIEIFIICDGSPPHMVSFFEEFAKEDPRIKVFAFPKSPRTGEAYRDILLRKQAKGKNVFYCCHDDLWFPDHITELEPLLKYRPFINSLHAGVNENAFDSGEHSISHVYDVDLEIQEFRNKMLDDNVLTNYFGLTCGAHSMASYLRIKKGWTNTPIGIWTDLYMWRKFLVKYGKSCGTLKKITSLHFQHLPRITWTQQQRSNELEWFLSKFYSPGFLHEIQEIGLKKLLRL
jgi:glycosyltransferase involved in cell wall biosynthesis